MFIEYKSVQKRNCRDALTLVTACVESVVMESNINTFKIRWKKFIVVISDGCVKVVDVRFALKLGLYAKL